MKKVTRLEVDGFRSVCSPVVLGHVPGTFALAGQNGAGKTTLLAEALWWALSGESFRGDDANDVVNRDAGKACVTVHFEDDAGREAVLTRTRTAKGSSRVKFVRKDDQGDVDLLAGHGTSKRGAREAVEAYLGVPLAVVRATTFYAPERGLLALTDAGRRALLEDALDLEWVEAAHERAKDRAAQLANRRIDLDQEAQVAKAQAEAKRQAAQEFLAQAQEAERNAERKREAQAQALGEQLATAEAEFSAAEESAAAANRDMAHKEAEVATKARQVEQLRQALAPLAEECARLSGLVAAADQACKDAKAAGALPVVGTLCPTCGRPFTAQDVETAKERQAAKLAEAAKTLQRYRQSYATALQGKQEIERMVADANAAYAAAANDLLTARQAAHQAAQVEATLRVQIEQLRAQLAALAQEDDGAGDVVARLKQAAAQAQAEADAAQKRHDEALEALGDVEHELVLVRYWQEAFGGKGMRALILEGVLPKLQARGSHYLAEMSDGRLALEVSAQKKAAKGKRLLERIHVRVKNVQGIDSTAACSSGEQRMADIALALALYDIVQELRDGAGLSYLSLDEALDALDEHHAAQVLKVLNQQATRRDLTVGLVSHNPRIRAGATRSLYVDRDYATGWTWASTAKLPDGPATTEGEGA